MRRTKVMPALIATGTAAALAVTGTTAWAASSGEEAASSQTQDESDLDMDVELLPPTVPDDGEPVLWEPVVHNNTDETIEVSLDLRVANVDLDDDNAVYFDIQSIEEDDPDTPPPYPIAYNCGIAEVDYDEVGCYLEVPPGETVQQHLRLEVKDADKADFSDPPSIDVHAMLTEKYVEDPPVIDHESRKLPLEHVE